MPSSLKENLARLKKWQVEQLSDDSFDFDYHSMYAHIRNVLVYVHESFGENTLNRIFRFFLPQISPDFKGF